MSIFQILYLFPKRNRCIVFVPGKNRSTETKNTFFGKCPFPKKEKECMKMSNSNNNQLNIPQAREAMDKFKMQAAQEVGVNLTNGYNGHLTSREAGSVGGQMVKNVCPIRTVNYVRNNRISTDHVKTVQYIAAFTV